MGEYYSILVVDFKEFSEGFLDVNLKKRVWIAKYFKLYFFKVKID